MEVNQELVRHVARLARLDLTDDEIRALAPQLSSILEYVEQVQRIQVDTGADPATSPAVTIADLRDDVPGETLDVHDVMRAAPESDGAFFVVPRVLGADDEDADA